MAQKKSAKDEKSNEVEKLRINRAFGISVLGLFLAALLVVFLILSPKFSAATDITSIVGLFTTTLGTIVGAFFGLQIGAAGKEGAEERADNAEKTASALSAAAGPDTIAKAKKFYPDLFK
ncbi:MAG: hypothetical protein WD751_07905 [Anaerolineales bacterium]